MDSLHDQDILLMELHLPAFEIFLSFLEVKARNIDFLTVQEIVKLLSEEIQIHRTETFEIIFSVLVPRSHLPLHKVVVQFDDLRIHSQDTALKGKPFRGRSLSAAGRSCYEDNLHTSSSGIYLVCNLGIFPFMQSLGKVDQIDNLSGKYF